MAFSIPSATYYDWNVKLDSGYYEVQIKRERKRKTDKEALKQAVADKPDAFLRELAEQFGCTVPACNSMDNASFHRKTRMHKLARRKVRLLFLPPYSPDYKSIEKSWANMKRFLRDNMQHFQDVDFAIYSYFEIYR